MASRVVARGLRRGLQRAALGAAMLALGCSEPAGAAQPAVNLQSASVTDLPGPASRTRIDWHVGVHAMRMRHGAVLLDSAVLLKVYVYAYSGQPVDYTAILTANTQMIRPPAPVIASPGERRGIDAMIAFAKTHPRLLIRVGDIALDPYVAAAGYYPIDNRLFIGQAGYYFDNSPYHYVYAHPAAWRHLRCDDAAVRRSIDRAIAGYVHFRMDIDASVLGASGATRALRLRVDRVRLLDRAGRVLIDQRSQDAAPPDGGPRHAS